MKSSDKCTRAIRHEFNRKEGRKNPKAWKLEKWERRTLRVPLDDLDILERPFVEELHLRLSCDLHGSAAEKAQICKNPRNLGPASREELKKDGDIYRDCQITKTPLVFHAMPKSSLPHGCWCSRAGTRNAQALPAQL